MGSDRLEIVNVKEEPPEVGRLIEQRDRWAPVAHLVAITVAIAAGALLYYFRA